MEEKTYRFYIRQGDFELDIEGDQAFVESYVEAFLEEAIAEESARPAKTRKALPAPKASAMAVKDEPDLAALSNFMKGVRPKTNKERFLCYLEFLRRHGVTDVAAKDIAACFGAQRVKAPGSIRQYFHVLKKQGLLEPSGNRGRWSLTAKGVAAASGNAKPAARKNGASRKAKGERKTASR